MWSGGTSRYTQQLSLFVCAVAYRSDYLIVITELQKLCAASNIDESTIAVRGSSHIGGHQYAGRYIFSSSLCPSTHNQMVMIMIYLLHESWMMYCYRHIDRVSRGTVVRPSHQVHYCGVAADSTGEYGLSELLEGSDS